MAVLRDVIRAGVKPGSIWTTHTYRALVRDPAAVYADWQNNDNLKNKLSSELLILLYKNGYPPEWKEEVYERVLEQVQNFKAHQA